MPEWNVKEWEYKKSTDSDACPVCGAPTKLVDTRDSELKWCGYDNLYECSNGHRRVWSTRRAWEWSQ